MAVLRLYITAFQFNPKNFIKGLYLAILSTCIHIFLLLLAICPNQFIPGDHLPYLGAIFTPEVTTVFVRRIVI
jgi:hypothetical protein